MKEIKTILRIFLTVLVIGCSTAPEPGDPDACACAHEDTRTEKNEELSQRCGELRSSNIQFEQDYQRCYIAARAGLDTSKVKINRIDSLGEINLPSISSGKYSILASASKINWLAKKVTGQHIGSLNVKSGDLEMIDGNLKGGTIVLDMTSIVVGDETGNGKTKLEGHLRGADFFSTTLHPEAKFVVTNSTVINKHQFEITGDLTLKGITKGQKAKLTIIPGGESQVNISGAMAIDRTLYDIRYGSGKFFTDLGDKMIDDIFMITIDLKARSN